MPDQQPLGFFDSAFLRKLESLTIFSRKVFAGRLRGEQRSHRYGSSVEFADFRPYSLGDDFRRIDWNAFARFGNLFLKLFTEEEDLLLYLLVDRSASMGFGGEQTKFDLARKVAAALGYVALANLDRVALLAMARGGDTPDGVTSAPDAEGGGDSAGDTRPTNRQDRLAFVRGKGGIFSVFEFLGQLRPAGQTDLAASVRDFLLHYRHKGVVVVLSDFLSPSGYEEPLKSLAFAGHQPMVIHLMAPEELAPEMSGDFRLVDSETRQALDISTTRRMLDGYQKRVRRFVDGLGDFCKRHDIAHITGSSDENFEEMILTTLRRAAMVR